MRKSRRLRRCLGGLVHEQRLASSFGFFSTQFFTKAIKVRLVDRLSIEARPGSFNQLNTECLVVLISANQLANIFATGSEPAAIDLLFHKFPKRFRKRNVHAAHIGDYLLQESSLRTLARFAKALTVDVVALSASRLA